MLDRLPLRFDPIVYTGSKLMINGLIKLSGMDRLAALLADTNGVFNLDLTFDVNGDGARVATGRLWGEVQPICQRCLSAVTVTIDIELNLAFVKTGAQMAQLPERYDPYLFDEDVNLKTLVEDEIILALPDIALHVNDDVCMPINNAQDIDLTPTPEQKKNPFAVLAQLKQNH